MKAIKIKDNVYWVGAIDWRLRNFHGYLTNRGSTYNAYLIIDEKITLIDSVKPNLQDEMIKRIQSVIDPAKIDVIICNHVEMDHSGVIPKIYELSQKPVVYASPKGVEGLKYHFGDKIQAKAVKTNDEISIGKRTLKFINTPMVHWPDNMITYSQEDKILFSNDAFGQHLATFERFDDEYDEAIVFEEAIKYYANIVLPYGNQVQKALEGCKNFDIDIICTSHGVIWRKKENIEKILKLYDKWSKYETEKKAVVIYDTMWNSTQKIANVIAEAFIDKGFKTELLNLQDTHVSDVMASVIDAKYVCIGSPTLNSNILPTVAGFIAYFKGLCPKNRLGFAFGSYGWGGQSVNIIDTELKSCGIKTIEPIKVKFVPTEDELAKIKGDLLQNIGENN